ncbi:Hypothetical predicted protein [Olea europaea subsp. europaea]|uniref:Uncharacterized protein n=1 Tax=Olea europaea subsp. europaea TaxID=158383 RepID=A0A8S0UIL4_OLEEU|nr:Hypothetical predicted protein [Olea europaea subsp. europaea]
MVWRWRRGRLGGRGGGAFALRLSFSPSPPVPSMQHLDWMCDGVGGRCSGGYGDYCGGGVGDWVSNNVAMCLCGGDFGCGGDDACVVVDLTVRVVCVVVALWIRW